MSNQKKERDQVLDAARIATRAVRAGQERTAEGEHAEPLFLTSSYVFENASQAADRFSGEEAGNVYSRYTNPTVRNFEKRLAALESAEAAVATSSGMAAILSVCMSLLKPGDHIVCSRSVFGSTTVLLSKYVARFGIEVSFVEPAGLDAWSDAIRPATRMLFLESPSNPLNEICDIAGLAMISEQQGALLVVDNCFCTPALQQPLALGADLVVHSATKYLDGQGRCVGGAVCGRQQLIDEVVGFLRSAGPTMSPFNAWVFLKGLETLTLRMQAHSANSIEIAHWLEQQDKVERVNYSGLSSHPQHELAARQQTAFGAVLSFTVKGGREQAWSLIDATRLMSITANLGDAKTTIVHPATTTHGRLSDAERDEQGITQNLVRVAVGLEDCEDLKEDLLRGLAAV